MILMQRREYLQLSVPLKSPRAVIFHLPFQTIGTKPIAHVDHFTAEMLGTAELAEEVNLEGSGKLVKVCLKLL